MSLSFEHKTALITGGSSGIGLAVAKKLAASGANVCLLARNPERLESACAEVTAARRHRSQRVDTLQADVSQPDRVIPVIQSYIQAHGVPDILINSAGVAHPGEFRQLNLDVFRWMMDSNYFGTVYATKAVVDAMIARKSGHIVNIASIAGFLGVYGYTAYGASKFAVRGFSDALRAELKPHGVRVSIVFPPDTKTPQLDYENQFKPPVTKALAGHAKAMNPDTVAEDILRGIRRNRYIIIPGIEGRWMFRLSNLLGSLIYPIMDWLVSDARRKLGGLEYEQRQDYETDPYQVGGQQVHELHPHRSQQDYVDRS